MGKTTIEWCTDTWNPVTGCTKVSLGCKRCYAERVFPRAYPGRKFTEVQTHPNRLTQPLSWRKPRRVFVNSMSDLFHESIPDAFIDRVFGVMSWANQHQYQVLTKRPERMKDYCQKMQTLSREQRGDRVLPLDGYLLDWPLPNCWLGVSVENQETADERIPLLLQTPAAVRFLSVEPLLSAISLSTLRWQEPGCATEREVYPFEGLMAIPDADWDVGKIGWVIVGGESGPHARPMHPDWVRSIRDECVTAGVPFFFKQWGMWVHESQQGVPYAAGLQALGMGHKVHQWAGGTVSAWVGKKAAGCLLDGRNWDQMPVSL